MASLFRLKFRPRAGSMPAMVIDLPTAPHAAARPSDYDERLDGLTGLTGLMGLGGLSVGAKLTELERFARLMQTQGQGVDATRMLYDMPYAFVCLDGALDSDCEPLRQLAERLHAQFQRAGHFLGLI